MKMGIYSNSLAEIMLAQLHKTFYQSNIIIVFNIILHHHTCLFWVLIFMVQSKGGMATIKQPLKLNIYFALAKMAY